MAKVDFETKTANIKKHLLDGKSITSWEAITLYKCTRLSAVIFNLKNNHGLNIDSEMIVEDGVHFSRYFLKADVKTKQSIKDHLDRGGIITKEVAEQVFGCKYLNVVIEELRKEGINIVGEKVRPICGKKFTRYYIK